MSLQRLLNEEKIERINTTINDAKIKKEKAFKVYRFSYENLKLSGYESNVYANIYDSIRLGCESVLLFNGYKARKGEGHHSIVIECAKELMKGELQNEFNRIRRMRRRRHDIEYGSLEVSRADMIQAAKDAKKLLVRISELIQEMDLQGSLV
ncbi:hypothetical protein KKD19_02520 [Patescibacteria group bacterium]|nr:hypothetical protein [Patescibacteria group bacterium]MBU4512094.1 hypothetical protein [Patescibacteria group bacterium]MCG2693419.1 hypothetical protein [Candidatus Parcubacteria bacterium]